MILGLLKHALQECGNYTKMRKLNQPRASTFTCQEFIPSKTVVHILFLVKYVIPKDLKPMLFETVLLYFKEICRVLIG